MQRIVLWLGTTLGLALFATACGDSEAEVRARMAPLCIEATNMLTTQAAGVDNDTFQLMMENALQACGGACDAGDTTSCGHLDSHLATICGASTSVCVGLCAEGEGALKEHSCRIAGSAG